MPVSREKQMSLNPKVVRIVRRVVIACVVTAVALVGVWAYVFWRLATPLQTAPITFLWNGVYLFSHNGPTKAYTLPTRDGKTSEESRGAMLAVSDGTIYYEASEENVYKAPAGFLAIACIRPDATTKWYVIPKGMLKDGWYVRDMEVTGDKHVLLNLSNPEHYPAGVILLDTRTGKAALISEAVEARADSRPGSDMVALLKSDGSIFIRKLSDGTENSFTKLPDELQLLEKPRFFDDWTVDFASRTLFYNVDDKVTAHTPSTSQSNQVELPWRYGGSSGIAWHAATDQLWVSVRGPLMTDGVAVFDRDLNYKGSSEIGHMPPDPHPVPMTKETIDLLSKVAVKVEPVPALDRLLKR